MNEKHLLALAVVALSMKEESELQSAVDDIFDSVFMSATDAHEKEVLSVAFSDGVYCLEQARTLLSGGLDD